MTVASTSSVTGLLIFVNRLAGRVGFLLCHRTGLRAGNESVTFIAGDADDIGAAFKVHFQFRFPMDGSGIARPNGNDRRRYNPGQRGDIGH